MSLGQVSPISLDGALATDVMRRLRENVYCSFLSGVLLIRFIMPTCTRVLMKKMSLPLPLALSILLLAFTWTSPGQIPASATPASQPASLDLPTILYGAAYYHEYEPYERLDEDVRLMKQAGLNVVRMGESTWSLWEPEDGHFEYAWMDRVVDAMGKAGIKVIMGTPTYSLPVWLYHEHPEILA